MNYAMSSKAAPVAGDAAAADKEAEAGHACASIFFKVCKHRRVVHGCLLCLEVHERWAKDPRLI